MSIGRNPVGIIFYPVVDENSRHFHRVDLKKRPTGLCKNSQHTVLRLDYDDYDRDAHLRILYDRIWGLCCPVSRDVSPY